MVNECVSFLRVKKEVVFLEDEAIIEDTYNDIESKLSVGAIQVFDRQIIIRIQMVLIFM
ncbi:MULTISPECIES: hypothetical protein [Flavobacterium]|uniref:hypothetical protein n=1 Tax=Flavobacterium TaxID=237 RepID=UPI0013FDD2AD|nr:MULTISPECIES: hypothetical protein [Flavobacterium]MCH4829237.1 hypothetical protein [Flavobacterium columnare]QYS91525.1 hypothetical protein JJC04_01645 [Flavobacterium covae]